ncbi:MAG: hypothetical protein ACRDCW_06795 [Sarcina sp.]
MWNNPFMMLIWLAFLGGGMGGGLFGGGREGIANEINNEFIYTNLAAQNRALSEGVANGFYSTQAAVNSVGNSVERGLCNSTYTINDNMKDGFYALKSSMDACCCETQKNILESGYRNDIAIQQQTNTLVMNANQNTQAILDKLCAAELRELQAANCALSTQLTQAKVDNSIAASTSVILGQLAQIPKSAIPAYPVPGPWPCYGSAV